MTEAPHGYGRYSHGCRCETCTEAKREYTRALRNRRRRRRDLVQAGGGKNFVDRITHGYAGYQNHACRCQTCIEAANAAARDRYRRKQVKT